MMQLSINTMPKEQSNSNDTHASRRFVFVIHALYAPTDGHHSSSFVSSLYKKNNSKNKCGDHWYIYTESRKVSCVTLPHALSHATRSFDRPSHALHTPQANPPRSDVPSHVKAYFLEPASLAQVCTISDSCQPLVTSSHHWSPVP